MLDLGEAIKERRRQVPRKNSLMRQQHDQHPRDASTCSRIASLGSSGAQHDKIGTATVGHCCYLEMA